MFIVVEGIEGSGKSTLLAGLKPRFAQHGRAAVLTHEPGGTAAGEAIRTLFLDRNMRIDPLCEAFLVNAARAQHVTEVIDPALTAGRVVLCDRFTDSTLAYQGYGRGLDLGALRALCDAATGQTHPDLILLLDLPVQTARARLRMRDTGADRIEAQDDAFYERVRRGFAELARSPRHVVLDATVPPERLLELAWSCISRS